MALLGKDFVICPDIREFVIYRRHQRVNEAAQSQTQRCVFPDFLAPTVNRTQFL